MEEIFKMVLSIFLILVMGLTAAGIISASIDVSNAKSFQQNAVNQIENANFSPSVIEGCKKSAEKKGYTLTDSNYVYDEFGNTKMVELVLEYDYKIPFLNNLISKHKLRSFAN